LVEIILAALGGNTENLSTVMKLSVAAACVIQTFKVMMRKRVC
jgi:hypothetical protein